MSKSLFAIAIAAALVSTPLWPARANLLTNGSFEIGTFNPPMEDTVSLFSGDTELTGWTVVNGSTSAPSNLAWIGPSNPFGLTAEDGSYFLDLTGYADAAPYGGVQQSITTVMGQEYALTFYLGSSSIYNTAPDSITAMAGSTSGNFTNTLTGTNNWELETLDFVAGGPSTVITLTGLSGGKYIGLDNVSVDPVPEPSTLAILGSALMGVGLLGFLRMRRHSLGAT
ncbi:MAG TPA: DUF642 domain-containing protein [Stellaceae bacterium]|nr:DUF642 domain-containing protein [Stellaceae bacterium]